MQLRVGFVTSDLEPFRLPLQALSWRWTRTATYVSILKVW